jgi:hypothetical protein
LARTGQPANRPTESRTNEKTCDVEGSLDARTTDADKALVSDKEDVRLFVSLKQCNEMGTHDFSSIGVSYCDKLLRLLRLSATLFCLAHRLNLASRPVLKSDNNRWTIKSPPANGQIESDVVADVSVPSTGDKRASRRGGSMRGRRGVGGGRRLSTSSALYDAYA